jgi:pyruvate/2-oxoglutarate dehydrogenase complex dihydrolipoamide dehydrogenase (E3) component
VTMVNRSERILSREEREVSNLVHALFENQGIQVLTNMAVVKVEKKGDKSIVHFHSKDKDYFEEFDEILMAAGNVDNLTFNPEKAGIAVDAQGAMQVDRFMMTSVPHIAAAGDIVGPYYYTHTASQQGYIAGHNLFARNKVPMDYRVIPRCVFLAPEVASVGVTEEEAKQKGIAIKKGIMAVGMLGRANTANDFDGFVKIVTDKRGVIIGGSIVAPRAGELIHEVALAVQCRIKAETVANMIHAYPTYSEGIKIACSLVA